MSIFDEMTDPKNAKQPRFIRFANLSGHLTFMNGHTDETLFTVINNHAKVDLNRFALCWTACKNFETEQLRSVVFKNHSAAEMAVAEQSKKLSAADFLLAGVSHMADRASTYDTPAGERSMAKTVAMFNIHAGTNITEEQGWQFMEILKMVRSAQGPFKADSYEDACAYAGLAGEAAARNRA